MIEVKCPHCGKQMELTDAELAISQGFVVCPQCLGETSLDGIVDAARLQAIRAGHRERSKTTGKAVSESSFESFNYCPDCGKRLPASGMNFCPYCGVKLNVSAASRPVGAMPAASPVASVGEVEASTPEPQLVADAEVAEQETKSELRFRPYTFTPSLRHRRRIDEPAGPVLKAVGYFIIALLVLLLIFLIYLFIINKPVQESMSLAGTALSNLEIYL